MLILGVDTSGRTGSLALVRFEGEKPEVLDILPLEGGTFSAQLVPQISTLLAKHNLSKKDIDGFAVASGPGSFTGLRVGLAAVKGLAEVLQKPIAAVSLLEVVARTSESPCQKVAALDAGRGEVFARISDPETGRQVEELVSLAELVSKAKENGVITPDEKLADALRDAGAMVTVIVRPRADAVTRLGYEKVRAGAIVTPGDLDATYIRRSDAEIMRSTRDSK